MAELEDGDELLAFCLPLMFVDEEPAECLLLAPWESVLLVELGGLSGGPSLP